MPAAKKKTKTKVSAKKTKTAKVTKKKVAPKLAVKKKTAKVAKTAKTAPKKATAKPTAKVTGKPAKTAAKKPVQKPPKKASVQSVAKTPTSKPKPKTKTKTKMNTPSSSPQLKSIPVPPKAKAKRAAVEFRGFVSPLGDRVLVVRDEPENKTAGGLFLPDSMLKPVNRGEVVAHGAGSRDKKGRVRSLDVKLGDKVVWSDYRGVPILVDGAELLILTESEIIGVVL